MSDVEDIATDQGNITGVVTMRSPRRTYHGCRSSMTIRMRTVEIVHGITGVTKRTTPKRCTIRAIQHVLRIVLIIDIDEILSVTFGDDELIQLCSHHTYSFLDGISRRREDDLAGGKPSNLKVTTIEMLEPQHRRRLRCVVLKPRKVSVTLYFLRGTHPGQRAKHMRRITIEVTGVFFVEILVVGYDTV